MENQRNFDEIKSIIINLAKKHGIDQDEMQDINQRIRKTNWRWNYSTQSSQDAFEKDMFFFMEAINLYKKASQDGDWLAALNGVMMASCAAQDISNFLDQLMSDLRTCMLDSDQFQWPEFPDDYQVPEKYGYQGR